MKVEPEAVETDWMLAVIQLSVGVGVVQVAVLVHALIAVFVEMLAGQLIAGGVLSNTVTVNEHEAVLPDGSAML